MKTKLAAAGFAAALSLATISGAMATKPDPEHKLYVCHATASESNPYVLIHIDVTAVKTPHLSDPGHNQPSGNPDFLALPDGHGGFTCDEPEEGNGE